MINTKRLIIKPYSDCDETDMVELLMNDKIKETYIIPDLKNVQEAKKYFKKLQVYANSSQHYERGIYYNNQLIGFINDVEINQDTIEIGYVIHPNFHNQGFATETLRAVIDDLYHQGFKTIISCAFESNIASFKVMEKCGMKKLETSTMIRYQNIDQNCLYYFIKAS